MDTIEILRATSLSYSRRILGTCSTRYLKIMLICFEDDSNNNGQITAIEADGITLPPTEELEI